MPRYLAKRDTLIAHESRVVKAGDEFEATFPEHMKLGDNLELLPEAEKAKGGKAAKATGSDLV
jgi:hypothetical protein